VRALQADGPALAEITPRERGVATAGRQMPNIGMARTIRESRAVQLPGRRGTCLTRPTIHLDRASQMTQASVSRRQS
jgi:hypothetical protein